MTNYIISAEDLLACDKKCCVIIDCRFSLSDGNLGLRQYQEGHIPGAHYLHLENDLSGPEMHFGGRHPMPDLKMLATKLESFGINPLTDIILYDDNRYAFASRAWWLLDYIGLERIKVLNGGFQAWLNVGGGIDKRSPAPKSGKVQLQPKWNSTADYGEVKLLSETLDQSRETIGCLIDSRESKRYLGLEEPIDPVAGHIPGAINYPWQEISDAEGLLQPLDFHRQRWQELPSDTQAVVYCGSGITACVNLFSLALTGRRARLYPGSWSDWCSRMKKS